MTFAVSSTNLSGAIGGTNQNLKPTLDTDNGFDKILDTRVEKSIDRNKQYKAQRAKGKPVHELKSKDVSVKESSAEVSQANETFSKDRKEVSKTTDDRIEKLKKLAKKIEEGDGLDDKEIKKIKDEIDALMESLLTGEEELTSEQINELSFFVTEISEAIATVESKLGDLVSEVQSNLSLTNSETSTDSQNKALNQLQELSQTLENVQENISKLEKLLTEVLDPEKNISKTEFSELLSEISKDMETVSENTQKILENNPDLLKENLKTADNDTEITKAQISDEIKIDEEVKSTTVSKNENVVKTDLAKEDTSDVSSKLVDVDKTSSEEVIKAEELATDKNVEILKFENTLIRSAKVNNPVKAQAFEKNIMKQVVNHTTSNINLLENGSEMTLKLNPRNLGQVAVKLSIEKGIVLAEFNVESQAVKEVLESNLADLRNALSDKGFNLEGLDVSVGDNGTNEGSRQQHQGSNGKTKFFDILDVEEEILNANTSENSTTIDTLK